MAKVDYIAPVAPEGTVVVELTLTEAAALTKILGAVDSNGYTYNLFCQLDNLEALNKLKQTFVVNKSAKANFALERI